MKIFGYEVRKIKSDTSKIMVITDTGKGLFYYSPYMTVAEMLANSTVCACVNIIADAVAVLSCNVYKKDKENGRIKDESLNLSRLLRRAPNYNDTSFTFKQQIMLHLLLKGNAFIFIERNSDFTPRSLTPLDPDSVEIKMDTDGDSYYIYHCNNKSYKYNTDNILHIPAIRYNRLRGLSPMEYATHSAKTGLKLEEYTQNYFDGGIHSKLLLTVPAEVKNWTEEDSKRLTERFLNSYGGKENANKPLIMNKGMTATPINIAGNVDSQLIENRAFSEKEIAKIFRVPLFMLGSENSKFTNMEQANTNFLQHTLTPWLVRLQEYLNRLIPGYLQNDYYVEFDTNSMLRADYTSRWNNYKTSFQSGLLTLNQIMDAENLPRVDEDFGNKHLVLENYVFMEDGKNNSNNENDKGEESEPIK